MQDRPTELPIRPPVCPDCGTPMRYAASDLDKIYPVRHLMFVCDCGRASDQLVVPSNETSPANRTENTPE
jgi:hypothetical protein